MKKITLFLFSILFSFATSSIIAEESVDTLEFSDAELEQMLAPIALYPDSVLTHILIASTYPLELVQAARWVSKNPDLEPAKALEKVDDKEWDPSVKALIPFPDILNRLSEDLDWTQNLGDAFLQNEERVLSSIQSLRGKADQAGNLEKMEHMEITREDDNIIIQPVEREVVYVPYYDTRVVYGPWYWAHYPPVYWRHHHYYPRHGLYYWYPRVHVSFNFFFSAFHWHNHHLVVVDHHRHSRHYYNHRHIIRDRNSRRWSHNPRHRRGVAYRDNHARERFHSNRPSIQQTRATRRMERSVVSSRNTQLKKQHSGKTVQPSVRTKPQLTRQEKLRNQIKERQSTNPAPKNRSIRKVNPERNDAGRSVKRRDQKSESRSSSKSKARNLKKEQNQKSHRTENRNTRQVKKRDNRSNSRAVKPAEPRHKAPSGKRTNVNQRHETKRGERSNQVRSSRQNNGSRSSSRSNSNNRKLRTQDK